MKRSFIILSVLAVSLLSGCTAANNGTTTKAPGGTPEATLSDVAPIVDKDYKSDVPFEIIEYTSSSRHYYVQQTEGEVTLESATSIVRELYSKEAFAEDSGILGNVVIFDNTVQLEKGESPAFDIEERAEYASRDNVIHIGEESYPFEPAFK